MQDTIHAGVEDTLAELAEKVEAAEQAIRELVADRPDDSWTMRELHAHLIEVCPDWTSTVRSLAIGRLIESRVLEIRDDLSIGVR
jgi:hypothetical protein